MSNERKKVSKIKGTKEISSIPVISADIKEIQKNKEYINGFKMGKIAGELAAEGVPKKRTYNRRGPVFALGYEKGFQEGYREMIKSLSDRKKVKEVRQTNDKQFQKGFRDGQQAELRGEKITCQAQKNAYEKGFIKGFKTKMREDIALKKENNKSDPSIISDFSEGYLNKKSSKKKTIEKDLDKKEISKSPANESLEIEITKDPKEDIIKKIIAREEYRIGYWRGIKDAGEGKKENYEFYYPKNQYYEIAVASYKEGYKQGYTSIQDKKSAILNMQQEIKEKSQKIREEQAHVMEAHINKYFKELYESTKEEARKKEILNSQQEAKEICKKVSEENARLEELTIDKTCEELFESIKEKAKGIRRK